MAGFGTKENNILAIPFVSEIVIDTYTHIYIFKKKWSTSDGRERIGPLSASCRLFLPHIYFYRFARFPLIYREFEPRQLKAIVLPRYKH